MFVCVCVCALSLTRVWFCDPTDYIPPGSSPHGIFPAKNTGVGCHFLLQRIFPTQGLNPCPLQLHAIYFFTTEPPGNPKQCLPPSKKCPSVLWFLFVCLFVCRISGLFLSTKYCGWKYEWITWKMQLKIKRKVG